MSKGPKGISQFAYTFIIAAERCSVPRPLPDGKFEMPLVPGLICRAFSIELNFKAIISQEGSNARGHKLAELFKQIKESTRNEIIKNSKYSKELFDEKLKTASGTFVEWRYMYEQDTINCDLDFLKTLSEVVQELSRNLCQE